MTQVAEFKGPIVEGAYYERGDGNIALSKASTVPGMLWLACVLYHTDCGIVVDPLESGEHTRLTRRVYITHADPAEVMAELRRLEDEANAFICEDDDYREDNAGEAYGRAADLVESMLGLARCGENCDGNCELTAYGPTKAEAEVAELRSKATEIVTELRAEVADLARHNWNEYIRDRSEALTEAANLVAKALGVKL
ncbi:MAG: hypothetical protein IPO08_20605 [Xanthomonadales bacterium]|nr:hypothetical protein [Xanthomonadales bacterium]